MTAQTLAERLRNHVAPSRAEMAAYADEVEALADPEAVAEQLYRMNGRAWYGRDLGDWHDAKSDIGGNEFEKDRWRRQAKALAEVAS